MRANSLLLPRATELTDSQEQYDEPALGSGKRIKLHQYQLTSLPDDCLNHIYSFCSASDLCAIRRTCSRLKASIHPSTWRSVFTSIACSRIQQCTGLHNLFFRPEYLDNARSALAKIEILNPMPDQVSNQVLIGFSLSCNAAIHRQIWLDEIINVGTKNWSAEAFATMLAAVDKIRPFSEARMDALQHLCIGLYKAKKNAWSVSGVTQLMAVLNENNEFGRYAIYTRPTINGLLQMISSENKQAWSVEELEALDIVLRQRKLDRYSIPAFKSVQDELANRAYQRMLHEHPEPDDS